MTYSTNEDNKTIKSLGIVPKLATDYVNWLYTKPYPDIPINVLFKENKDNQKDILNGLFN